MTQAPWLFRVASHRRHGGGHLARCLSLAKEVVKGAPVIFALDEGSEAAARQVAALGFDSSPASDLPNGPIRGSVVDGYGFGADTIARLAAMGPVIAIDDSLSPPSSASLAINAAMHLAGDQMAGVPALLGPAYALVDRRFCRNTGAVRRTVDRVLVTFGKVDPDNVTCLALDALLQLAKSGVAPAVTAIAAGNSPHLEEMSDRIARFGEPAEMLIDVPDMQPELERTDLVIGAGGVSLFERVAMGVPSITVGIAQNQELFVHGAEKKGVTRNAGTVVELDTESLAGQIAGLIADFSARRAMAERCRTVIDGRGPERVALAMEEVAERWNSRQTRTGVAS